tara:strand:+ start:292 stop:924 length:633 start_codon:yes stop_codon:yes gene_type:complete
MKDAINLPSKTLGDFNRLYGKDWVVAYLNMWLIDLNDSSGVKNPMGDAQIEFTSERIYESYSLKVTDLTLFFRNIKEGVYGAFYENLSQEKIMSWLKEYFDLRCEYGQMSSQSKEDGYSLSKDKVNPEVIKKMFEGVGDVEVEFTHEKNGIGARKKQVITKDLITEIRSKTIKELREYLVSNDIESPTYNEYICTLVGNEIDYRNQQFKK